MVLQRQSREIWVGANPCVQIGHSPHPPGSKSLSRRAESTQVAGIFEDPIGYTLLLFLRVFCTALPHSWALGSIWASVSLTCTSLSA